MTDPIPDAQVANQACGQIRLAIRRLASKYPFHAAVLERFEIERRDAVQTMAVTTAENYVQLLFNPEFVLSVTLDELGGVLLHEVHHVVFGHLLVNPDDYPDDWARTVAEEVTVNEFVTEPLPGAPIRLEDFPRLPEMESTAERYRRLEKYKTRPAIASPVASPCSQPDGEGRSSSPSTNPDPTKNQGDAMGTTDDHSVWAEALANRDQAEAAVRAAIQDAAIKVGQKNIPDYLVEAVQGHRISSMAGTGEFQLQGNQSGQLDWRRLLRRYVGSLLSIQPDFTRPSRRLPELVGIVPGKRRRGTRPRIMAAVDTSASITPMLLEIISAELKRLAADYDVLVVECDAKIQRVYRYRPLNSARGRGGTSLCPPLETGFLKKHRIDLAIYFTDGFGKAPEKSPGVPVIWCLTEAGACPANWGREVRMTHSKLRKQRLRGPKS